MEEIRAAAATAAGHAVPIGANAGLLWPRHLSDYKTLDLFSAETDHHAAQRHFSDLPLFAYRLADAVDRPYAATASGGDWAFIKEENRPGLVRGWIALSYAAGHNFMVPNRQWCYTPQKGTHWYLGPAEKFAPLYQFVRRHRELFDPFQSYADIEILLPHHSFASRQKQWFDLANELAAHSIAYRIVLAGDDIVDHPLAADSFSDGKIALIPDQEALSDHDQQIVHNRFKKPGVFKDLRSAMAAIHPAVQVRSDSPVRAVPRVASGSAAVHLLNYEYDPASDDIRTLQGIRVMIDSKALGLSSAKTARWFTPEHDPITLAVVQGSVEIPTLGLWGILLFKDQPNDHTK